MPVTETKASAQVAAAVAWLLARERPTDVEARLVAKFSVKPRRAREIMAAARAHLKAAGIDLPGKRPPLVPAQSRSTQSTQRDRDPAPGKLAAPPTKDALAQVDWLLQALVTETHRALAEEDLTPLGRLDQLRATARACSSLLPPERLYDAEQLLKRHAQGLMKPTEEGLTDASNVEARHDDNDPQGVRGSTGGAVRFTPGRRRR